MPNDLLKTIGDYLNPEDVLTLAGPLAGFKPTAGITAALYAPSLNENEAEELDKIRAMRPPVAAPRETVQTPEMRDFVNRLRYEQFVGDLRKQYGQHADLMLQGLIKQGLQDEAQQARMTGPRAKPPAPPAARHEATVPEGRFRRYNGGGKVKGFKFAKEMLTEPLYHAGSYQRGQSVTQPLYLTPAQRLAQGYVDPTRIPGSQLQELRPDVKNPAPERLVNAAARKFVPENRFYSPASAFDRNLHDPGDIEALIAELRRRGYDSAVAGDVSPSGQANDIGDALVLFPGAKAYAEGGMIEHTTPDMADGGRMIYTDSLDSYAGGGGVKGKTVQQMADELLTKGVKTPDLSRRGFLRLPDLGGPKESKLPVPAKDMERFQTEKTTVDPLSGSVEKVVEKVAQTPMSRRQVLQGALAQAAQRVLPSVAMQPVKDVAQSVVQEVAKTTAPKVAPTIGGLVAEALKMGLDENQAVEFVHSMLPGLTKKMVADHLDYMYPVMKDPYDVLSHEATHAIESADEVDLAFDAGKPVLGSPVQILGDMISPTISHRGMNLRPTLRGIRQANPEKYDEMKQAARDAAEYLYEP